MVDYNKVIADILKESRLYDLQAPFKTVIRILVKHINQELKKLEQNDKT